MGLYQIKQLCTSKKTIIRVKRQPTEWAKIFTSYLYDEELISRIYKELKKLNTQRTITMKSLA
jgi:hypothetical protein